MSKKGVQSIIDSIREAVEKKCWIPALTTALTLPDIMGQIEFPELVNKRERRLVKQQYTTWFAKHVEHWFADEQGWNKDGIPINPYFTADMCYQLRCSVLHQGNDDVKHDFSFENEKDSTYSYTFELRVNACDSYGSVWPSPQSGEKLHKTIHVRVDVGSLCVRLCDEAQSFLDSYPEDTFSQLGIDLVDVQAFRNSLC